MQETSRDNKCKEVKEHSKMEVGIQKNPIYSYEEESSEIHATV